MKELGNKIKQYRKAARITQLEMADKVGCCYVTISSLEHGKSVTTDTLDKVLKILNLKLEVIHEE